MTERPWLLTLICCTWFSQGSPMAHLAQPGARGQRSPMTPMPDGELFLAKIVSQVTRVVQPTTLHINTTPSRQQIMMSSESKCEAVRTPRQKSGCLDSRRESFALAARHVDDKHGPERSRGLQLKKPEGRISTDKTHPPLHPCISRQPSGQARRLSRPRPEPRAGH